LIQIASAAFQQGIAELEFATRDCAFVNPVFRLLLYSPGHTTSRRKESRARQQHQELIGDESHFAQSPSLSSSLLPLDFFYCHERPGKSIDRSRCCLFKT